MHTKDTLTITYFRNVFTSFSHGPLNSRSGLLRTVPFRRTLLPPSRSASGSLTERRADRELAFPRPLIPAPREGTAPLTERRSNRELPQPPQDWKIWAKTLPIFIAIMTVSALVIFNYQKQCSSVVASTLYALRTSEIGRRELGDEIYFRDRFPWIWGEMNQLKGRIDIQYGVKGTKGSGMMRFRCVRKRRMGFFETKEWSLETKDGRVIQLLDEGKADPFRKTAMQSEYAED